MKKVLVFLLVAFVAVAGVFAVDISLGLGTGFEQEILFMAEESGGSYSFPFNKIPVVAVSTFDFSNNFSLGVDLGINVCFTNDLGFTQNQAVVPFFIGVTAYHKFGLPSNFNLYLGGGLRYVLTSYDTESNVLVHGLSMLMDVKATYDVLENLIVFCRANFGQSLCKYIDMGEGFADFSSGMFKYIQWSATIGAAYKF